MNNYSTINIIFMIMFPSFLILLYSKKIVVQNKILKEGIKAQGTIVHIKTKGRRGNMAVLSTIEFETSSGKDTAILRSRIPYGEIGTPIEIMYLESDTKNIVAKKSTEYYVWLLIGVVLLILSIYSIVSQNTLV